MRHRGSIATILALGAFVAVPCPARAGEVAGRWWAPHMRSKDTVGGESSNKVAADATVPAPTPPPAAPVTTAAPVTAVTPAATAATPTPPPTVAAPTPPPTPLPDASLSKIIGHLRQTPIGNEPTVVVYLDRIAAGRATASQVNDFAVYMAKRGMPKVGIAFQEYALKLRPQDTTLWLNLGTMRQNTGSLGAAADAFKKAIDLDAGNALAHYSLGSVYDAEKSYDAAIEEYRRALVIDPTLADPRKNPQVVNNENLLAVRLKIYQNQAGSLGLPLLQMQKPSSTQAPKNAAQKP